MATNEQSIRILSFKDKPDEFRMWIKKFLSQAHKKGYKDVLLRKVKVPAASESLDPTKESDKAKLQARKANDDAYSALILSCDGPISFGAIERAITKELPEGDAALALDNLYARFEKRTKLSMVNTRKEFTNSKLESGRDPDEWFVDLEYLRNRMVTMGSEIGDDEYLAHVINNLPKEYETTKTILELQIRKDDLSIDELQEIIRERWDNLKINDEDDTALAAKFKGTCNYCGKQGHKRVDCRKKKYDEKNNNKNEKNEKKSTGNEKKKAPYFPGICNVCKKKGHKAAHCWHNTNKTEEANTVKDNSNGEEVAFMVCDECNLENKEEDVEVINLSKEQKETIWFADSAATSHMKNNTDGMCNLRNIDGKVKIGDGKQIEATLVGDFHGIIQLKDGSKKKVKLTDVKVVPSLWCNLFSVIRGMQSGGKLSNDKNSLTVTKGNIAIQFSLMAKNKEKSLLGVKIEAERKEVATVMKCGTKININTAHTLLGHMSEAITRETCKLYGWEVIGKLDVCEDCGKAKAKQRNVPKISDENSDKDKFYFDVSSIKGSSYGGSKHWLHVVHGETKMKWSMFLKTKDEVKDKMTQWVDEIRSKRMEVKTLRCDNAAENKDFSKHSKQAQMGLIFEFTAPHTPQQNGIVERSFPTIGGRVRAMMSSAGIEKELRTKLWAETVNMATQLDTLTPNGKKSRYENFFKTKPQFASQLKQFGEMGVIAIRDIMKNKLNDRGRVGMMVGYSKDHAGGVYRMWVPDTQRIIESRDITWLNKIYKEYVIKDSTREGPKIEVIEDDDEEPGNLDEKQVYKPKQELSREVRNLHTFYNNVLDQVDIAMAANEKEENTDPTYEEAINGPNHKEWKEAILEELENFEEKGVWRPINMNDLPKGKKLIDSKWVLKKKHDGRFRARLVAKGFTQIPGVDFTESFSPVVNDITLRILITIWIMKSYYAEQIDVVAAFLLGPLDEEIYLKCPVGYDLPTNKCLLLLKSMYGLVQAARQFWKLFCKEMKGMKFNQSQVDPCLYHKKTDGGMVYVLQYVDDGIILGSEEMVKNTILDIKKRMRITETGRVKEYIGCSIYHDKNRRRAVIHQTRLIETLEKMYGVEESKEYKTPAAPGTVLEKAESPVLIDEEKHQEYRTGVGKLLWLLKHSRPDLSNAVRELSKVLDDTEPGHYKAMNRCIQFVLKTKNLGLKIEPKEGEPQLIGIADSSYASEKSTRRSVSGWLIFYHGVLISWKSRAQRSVTLSSTESEYVGLTEMVCEILFAKNLLLDISIKVDFPIKVFLDNTGAIHMTKNRTTGGRTKHIDTRYHFIRELVDDGTIEVNFVGTADNEANMFTKNVGEDEYNKMLEKNLVDIGEFRNN
jgi:Reverse transcriptase (RNA-dependent DNA polymerase)/gag-polypeptide of LTR copia-type